MINNEKNSAQLIMCYQSNKITASQLILLSLYFLICKRQNLNWYIVKLLPSLKFFDCMTSIFIFLDKKVLDFKFDRILLKIWH